MDPGAPNSGKRFESSHQIFSPELRTISVAPPVSLSFRFLVNILIRHCFMLDPMILYGEQCLWFSILERGSSLCFWWAFPVSLSTKTGAGSQRASLGLVEGTKSRAGGGRQRSLGQFCLWLHMLYWEMNDLFPPMANVEEYDSSRKTQPLLPVDPELVVCSEL